MIFVTVGSTFFDGLIREVDRLVAEGIIKDDVMMQIGSGEYIPKSAKYFRYAPHLEPYYESADMVITHAAAGTLFPLLKMGKKILAVTNPRLKPYFKDDHKIIKGKTRTFKLTSRQMGLPMKLEEEGYLVWCPEVRELKDSLKELEIRELKTYSPPKCNIPEHIDALLQD